MSCGGFGLACCPPGVGTGEATRLVAWWGREVWVLGASKEQHDPVLQHATLPDRVTALLPLGLEQHASAEGGKQQERLAIATADKVLRVGPLDGGDVPANVRKEVPKKVIQLLALPSEQPGLRLLLADKFGDVHRWEVAESEGPLRSLVGHVSQLTCMAMSPNQRYLVTADRDEKVRVSHYPHSFEIAAYCLGAPEFTTCLAFLPPGQGWPEGALLSGGCDGRLVLWDGAQGRRLLEEEGVSVLELARAHRAEATPTALAPSPAILHTLRIRPATGSEGGGVEVLVGLEQDPCIYHLALSQAGAWSCLACYALPCKAVLALDVDGRGMLHALCYHESSSPDGEEGAMQQTLALACVDVMSRTVRASGEAPSAFYTVAAGPIKNGSEAAVPLSLKPWALLRKDPTFRNRDGAEEDAEEAERQKPDSFHKKRKRATAQKAKAKRQVTATPAPATPATPELC